VVISMPLATSLQAAEQMIDGIPAQVALIDADGVIRAINEHWRNFASDNGYGHASYGLGTSYVHTCERADGDYSAEANVVARGLRDVLRGVVNQFQLVYPCHSPIERRWFRMIATPTPRGSGAVVCHFNITPEMLSEEREVLIRIRLEQKLTDIEKNIRNYFDKEILDLNEMSNEADQAVEEYGVIFEDYVLVIESNLNERLYKVDSTLAKGVARLATKLGKLQVDASFVARLHADALKVVGVRRGTHDTMWVANVSREVFIGVLGNLLNYYMRNTSVSDSTPQRSRTCRVTVTTKGTAEKAV
jgi:hypothetical protein